jgi:hypothetical protein
VCFCVVCQNPTICQQVVSQVTGLPRNKVTVTTRRIGGGYGGKTTRASCVNGAAAVAAYLTGRQVHVQLDRVQDMQMVGGDALCMRGMRPRCSSVALKQFRLYHSRVFAFTYHRCCCRWEAARK